MPAAPLPANEPQRLLALVNCGILDSEPERSFDQITAFAARLSAAPIALISLVDESRQWFKSRVGLEATQTHRDDAFCAYAILSDEPLVILDASMDARTRDNPLVLGGPKIRFYAGMPLRLSGGEAVGTLCVIDTAPREVVPDQLVSDMKMLADQAVALLQLRLETSRADAANEALQGALSKIEEKNDELTRLIYTASHDLKSPIVTITGYMNYMLQDLREGRDEELEEYASRVLCAADRMQKNIDDVLQVSRVGLAKFEPQMLDLRSMIGEVVGRHQGRIKNQDVTIEIALETEDVWCDKGHLTQVLDNLIVNALNYGCTGEAPKITIRSEIDAKAGVRIAVDDNGVGIDARHLKRIFRLFERVSSGNGGTGVGLAIVHRVAEYYGGNAWAESEAGHGSSFRVTFPSGPIELDGVLETGES